MWKLPIHSSSNQGIIMYFSGKLSIDPSQATHIDRIKPTKAFRRILYLMTAGRVSDKEEIETFTAVSILQQFNNILRTMGVTNLVRLAKDNVNFYMDTEGKKDDLKEALDDFRLEVDDMESELFKKLILVAEHEDAYFKYLIEVDICRDHAVGEYPINLIINAVHKDFACGNITSKTQIQNKLKDVFKSQDTYSSFLHSRKQAFELFQDRVELEVRKFIHCDNIMSSSQTKIVRPRKPVKNVKPIQHQRNAEPVFHGYYGYDDSFWYAWYWADMCHDHNIHCSDVVLVDELGQHIMTVGDEGFDAGASDTLNSEAPFEVPATEDITCHAGSVFEDSVKNSTPTQESDDGGERRSSFLDSFSFSDGGSSDSDSSCSSCSSCGSD